MTYFLLLPMNNISVIIGTHNRMACLENAVCSIHAQTRKPVEIIIVDDGSDISVEEIFSQKVKELTSIPVRFIRLDDVGPSQARNAGAQVAKGEGIALLDDDDYWASDYLEKVQGVFNASSCECVISWKGKYKDDCIMEGKCLPKNFKELDLFCKNWGVSASNIVIKKESFHRLGGFDPDLLASEDKDFFIRMIDKDIAIEVLDCILVYTAQDAPHIQLSGANINRFKYDGKHKFFEKYKDRMSKKTYRRLKGELGYLQSLWGGDIFQRIKGFFYMCCFRRDYVCRYMDMLFRK